MLRNYRTILKIFFFFHRNKYRNINVVQYTVLHIKKEEFELQQDETNSNECHSLENVALWLDRMFFLELRIRKSFCRILDYTDIILCSSYPLILLNILISIPFPLHMYNEIQKIRRMPRNWLYIHIHTYYLRYNQITESSSEGN